MSKIGTLKHLPTPADVRENVQQLGQMLDATVTQLKSLEQLPQLVADQVSEALAPILTMRADVNIVLEHYNKVTTAQRESLEQMAQELSDRATVAMQQKAEGLDQTIQVLVGQVKDMKASMLVIVASSEGLQALPTTLSTAASNAAMQIQTEAGTLAEAAAAVRPDVWLVLSQMLGAAVLGALLVAAGQVALNRILPPGETQQNADWASSLWDKASESEKKLLTQIVSRPAK